MKVNEPESNQKEPGALSRSVDDAAMVQPTQTTLTSQNLRVVPRCQNASLDLLAECKETPSIQPLNYSGKENLTQQQSGTMPASNLRT